MDARSLASPPVAPSPPSLAARSLAAPQGDRPTGSGFADTLQRASRPGPGRGPGPETPPGGAGLSMPLDGGLPGKSPSAPIDAGADAPGSPGATPGGAPAISGTKLAEESVPPDATAAGAPLPSDAAASAVVALPDPSGLSSADAPHQADAATSKDHSDEDRSGIAASDWPAGLPDATAAARVESRDGTMAEPPPPSPTGVPAAPLPDANALLGGAAVAEGSASANSVVALLPPAVQPQAQNSIAPLDAGKLSAPVVIASARAGAVTAGSAATSVPGVARLDQAAAAQLGTPAKAGSSPGLPPAAAEHAEASVHDSAPSVAASRQDPASADLMASVGTPREAGAVPGPVPLPDAAPPIADGVAAGPDPASGLGAESPTAAGQPASGVSPTVTPFAPDSLGAPNPSAGTRASAAPRPVAHGTEPPARQLAPIAVALALGHAPRLTITLQPAELGRVELRLDRGAEGEAATLRVVAERPETLALLQRDARELTRALDQAGVATAGMSMSFDLSREHSGQLADQRAAGERRLAPPPASHAATGLALLRPAERAGVPGLGLLDIAV